MEKICISKHIPSWKNPVIEQKSWNEFKIFKNVFPSFHFSSTFCETCIIKVNILIDSIDSNWFLFLTSNVTLLTHFFLNGPTITIYSLNTKRTNLSRLEKSLSKKYVHILGCQKKWAFHIGLQKNRVIHIIFVEKRRPIIYLEALKKRAIRHAHLYYALYRKLPPPRPPPSSHHQYHHAIPESSGWPWKSINRETNLFNYWNLLKHLVCRFSKYTYSLEHTQ